MTTKSALFVVAHPTHAHEMDGGAGCHAATIVNKLRHPDLGTFDILVDRATQP